MMYLAFHDDPWVPPPDITPSICLSDRFDIHALVSEEDYVWAMKWKWSYKWAEGAKANKTGIIYAYRQIRISGRKVTLWLHREVTHRKLGPPPSPLHMSDHINGDSLDCRRGNLRWATPSENAKNRLKKILG